MFGVSVLNFQINHNLAYLSISSRRR